MGEIRKRERNGRVTYLARHYDRSSGRKVSKSFDRKQDANDWLSHVGESKRTGSYVDPNRSGSRWAHGLTSGSNPSSTWHRRPATATKASCGPTSSRDGAKSDSPT